MLKGIEVEVGSLKPVDGNKNFTGENITAEFKIYNEIVEGTLKVYNANGIEVKDDDKVFDFDGTEKGLQLKDYLIFNEELMLLGNVKYGTTKAAAGDFEIKYAENVTGVPNSKHPKLIQHMYMLLLKKVLDILVIKQSL